MAAAMTASVKPEGLLKQGMHGFLNRRQRRKQRQREESAVSPFFLFAPVKSSGSSILVEKLLELVYIAGLLQPQPQVAARLLGVQSHPGDEPQLVVVDLDVTVGDARGGARTTHDRHALFHG